MNQHKIAVEYMRNRLSNIDDFISGKTTNPKTKRKYKTRSSLLKIRKYVTDFSSTYSSQRWFTIMGLRGVGKTTLLCQLYEDIAGHEKIFISIDDAIEHGVTVKDIVDGYEVIIGTPYERLQKPVYLFLDEVHFDKRWAISLKTLFDRSPYIFILTTGSSAYEIIENLNKDSSRRIHVHHLNPLSMTEFLLLNQTHYPVPNLGKRIREIIYGEENDAKNVYRQLLNIKKDVLSYWEGIEYSIELKKYALYGTLPFSFDFKDGDNRIYELIFQTIQTIINKDFNILSNSRSQTTDKILPILYSIADSQTVSVRNLSKTHEFNRITVDNILKFLVEADVLHKIFGYSGGSKQIASNRLAKYCFTSSAYRSALFNARNKTVPPSIKNFDHYKGFLLEDVIHLYLRILRQQLTVDLRIYHDDKDGADFILQYKNRLIAIEVGYGKQSRNKKMLQSDISRKRHQCNYGLVISNSPLKLTEDERTVNIPLACFLLTA